MFIVLIFFGVTYRPQLDTPPSPLPLPPPPAPFEISITVCHEKGRHAPTP